MKYYLIILSSFMLLVFLPVTLDGKKSSSTRSSLELKRIGKLDFEPISESSGLVRSRQWPDWMWTHNDSGDKARIFAVKKKGSIVRPESGSGKFKGITIHNAVNIDWEDIAIDTQGNLIIAACGNNSNARRDLALYIIPEPNVIHQAETRTIRTIPFRYPDQKTFPPKRKNFDCEAVFFAHGKIYLLTKHRADTLTKLYRFDTLESDQVNIPTLVDQFDVRGQVTAADVSDDGTQLAVLTYSRVWLFETEHGKDDYFDGTVFWGALQRIKSKQCEGICFWDDSLIISNEHRELYEISLNKLRKLQL